jgi:hypothetical protein
MPWAHGATISHTQSYLKKKLLSIILSAPSGVYSQKTSLSKTARGLSVHESSWAASTSGMFDLRSRGAPPNFTNGEWIFFRRTYVFQVLVDITSQ